MSGLSPRDWQLAFLVCDVREPLQFTLQRASEDTLKRELHRGHETRLWILRPNGPHENGARVFLRVGGRGRPDTINQLPPRTPFP